MNTILLILCAVSPIAVVLYLMIVRNWGGSQAGPMGWLTAVLVALLVFGGDFSLLLVSLGRALLLAVYVLYIIWMALLLYHVVNDAGVIQAIGQELPHLASEKTIQALLLAWVFGSFLQGASGFGVPAAVVAPLLVGLGFRPTVAVVAALMGHAWAVSFGSLGSSFFTLIAASGMEGEILAGPSAIYLGLACLACGFAVLWATGQWTAIRQQGVLLIGIGLVMAITQYFLARLGLWSLAAFGAGLMGLIVMIVVLNFTQKREAGTLNWGNLGWAFFPYAIMTVIIVGGQVIFKEQLDVVVINYNFPELITGRGYVTPAGDGRSISLFGHAGALLLYSAVVAFLWYKVRGVLPTGKSDYNGREILNKTVKGSRKSTISIIALVAMATTMQHAGMTQLLAETLSNTGVLFPFLSPFIGALGAFMTGSNTNSNVVFAGLQQQTAVALNLLVPYILAAQNTGGALGSVFAPAKVIVGCSTVEGADDAAVLKLATVYGLVIVALVGALTLFIV
ncbi:MAG: L-lactate permease [Anaerolineales bacterium]|nr:L-lactate permease [Anaerolineales bacterium]